MKCIEKVKIIHYNKIIGSDYMKKLRKLTIEQMTFLYNQHLDVDDFMYVRKTADDFVFWCISKQKEMVIRR